MQLSVYIFASERFCWFANTLFEHSLFGGVSTGQRYYTTKNVATVGSREFVCFVCFWRLSPEHSLRGELFYSLYGEERCGKLY